MLAELLEKTNGTAERIIKVIAIVNPYNHNEIITYGKEYLAIESFNPSLFLGCMVKHYIIVGNNGCITTIEQPKNFEEICFVKDNPDKKMATYGYYFASHTCVNYEKFFDSIRKMLSIN